MKHLFWLSLTVSAGMATSFLNGLTGFSFALSAMFPTLAYLAFIGIKKLSL